MNISVNGDFRLPVAKSTGNTNSNTIDTQHPKIGNPTEAAKTFEKVLVEQFVNVMTEQLFKSNLSGEDGPGWMKAQGDTQRRVLTEILSDHLVENGTFNISDIVLKQWQRNATDSADE